MKRFLTTLIIFVSVFLSFCLNASFQVFGAMSYEDSLLIDFDYRLSLPQTDVPQSKWYNNPSLDEWGPWPKKYPPLDNTVLSKLPKGTNITQWKRDRAVAIAKYYIGLPYKHHHIPRWNPPSSSKGLDCSNFTAWVYNLGFGIMINSNVKKQAQMLPAKNCSSAQPGMKKIEKGQKLYPGDLLFIGSPSSPYHVAMYINENEIIDSIGSGVNIRPFNGLYKNYAFAIRIFN